MLIYSIMSLLRARSSTLNNLADREVLEQGGHGNARIHVPPPNPAHLASDSRYASTEASSAMVRSLTSPSGMTDSGVVPRLTISSLARTRASPSILRISTSFAASRETNPWCCWPSLRMNQLVVKPCAIVAPGRRMDSASSLRPEIVGGSSAPRQFVVNSMSNLLVRYRHMTERESGDAIRPPEDSLSFIPPLAINVGDSPRL